MAPLEPPRSEAPRTRSSGGARGAPRRGVATLLKDAFGLLFSVVSSVVPKGDRMVFASMDAYAGNARAFYETVRASAESAPSTLWLSLGPDQDASLGAYSIRHVRLGSLRGLWAIARARWIVSTHGEMARFRALRGQTYVNLWHGLPFKNTGFLWSQAEGEQYRLTAGRSDVMPCSSPFSQAVMASVFHIRANRLVVTGYPRNDALTEVVDAQERLARVLDDPDFDRAILYCPTHRQTLTGTPESSWTFQDFLDRYLLEPLVELLQRERIRLVVKVHPFDERRITERGGRLAPGVELLTNARLAESRVELYEILGAFDALWTDYSSISCDYLLTGKPIFYLVEDLEEYLSRRGVVLSDFPLLAPGPHVRSLEELVQALERWLDEPDDFYRSERAQLTRLMHTARPPYGEGLLRELGFQCA